MARSDDCPSRSALMAGPRQQRGIALMLVMWVLTLLTVMAVSLTASQRTETALAENQVSAARFRALADAAIAYTALDFAMTQTQSGATTTATTDGATTDEETESVWLPNGVSRSWRFAGADMRIAVFNESSRYDLNLIRTDVLTQLLEVLGVAEDTSSALAAAIVDWRDEDNLALLNGAEDDDYIQSGRVIGAKDDAYESVEELRQVYGMTEDLYRRLAPELTVDAKSTSPAERFASAPVLATMKGISLDEASQEVAERDQPTVPGATVVATTDRGGPLYRIQVTERGSGGAGQRMEALIKLTRGQQPPYQVLWRRYGLESADASTTVLESEQGD